MKATTKKAFSVAGLLLLIAAESTFFGRQMAAAVWRGRGEQAFFRNDLRQGWDRYLRARAWGADRDSIETDMLELLLLGLGQVEAGAKVRLPMPLADVRRTAHDLVVRLLHVRPYSAYLWSLASDVCSYEATTRRKEETLDLATLSEDPLENLGREEWVGIAALERSASLEPTNYIYHDLLVEYFLEIGVPERAAVSCRRAVAAYPVVYEHKYLTRPDLDPGVLEAAIQGFEDASREMSMVPPEVIALETARLLVAHHQDARALPSFRKALEIAPDLYDAQFEIGDALLRLGEHRSAIAHLRKAARIDPDQAWPHFDMGFAYRSLGDLPSAIEEFRLAREGEADPRFARALAETLEQAGQVKEAERLFRAAAQLNAGQAEGWLDLLAFYRRHDDVRGASEVCTGVASKIQDAGIREQCHSLLAGGS